MLLTNAAEIRGPFAKAKVQLILNHPFFSVLACHLPCVPMDARLMIAMGCPPTAMVDGKKIYYNPVWVATLTEKERLGLLAHEVLHPALGQLWRRGSRKRHLWLMATDYVVNDIILRTKVKNALGQEVPAFELPKPYLYDAKYTGMSAEQVYALLDKEEKEEEEEAKKSGKSKTKQKKEALDGQMEKPVEGEDDKKNKKGKKGKKGAGKKNEKDEAGGGGPKPDAPKQDKPEAGEGEGEGDEDDEEKDEQGEGGEGEGKGKPQPDDKEGESEKGEGDGEGDESDADEDGDGEGDGESDSDSDADGKGEGDGEGDEDGDGEGKGKGKGQGDSEGEGDDGEASHDQCEGDKTEYECDHAHGDIEEADGELKEFWKGVLNQAAIAAKGRGNLPGQLERLVEEVNEPKVAWQQIIESRVNDVCRDDYDMLVRDRRFQHIYFPELQANATHIAIFVDTSGSIGEKEIKSFVSEIVGILRCRGIKSVRIMSCDDQITMDVTISPTDELPISYPGGGGTDFRPPFKRLIDEPNGDRPALVIYLTDMCGTFPDKDPGFETIWLAACPSWMKADQLPKAPFGSVVPYDFMAGDDEDAA